MIVAMLEHASEDQIQDVTDHLMRMGFAVHRTTGARQSVLAAVGKRIDFDTRDLEVLPGVERVHRISAPYKLVGRQFRGHDSVIKLANGTEIGGKEVVVMAGPCSVESREQIFQSAQLVAEAGAKVLRGGAFKTSQLALYISGMGLTDQLMREAADAHHLTVISGDGDSQIDPMLAYVDIFKSARATCRTSICCANWARFEAGADEGGIAATIEEMCSRRNAPRGRQLRRFLRTRYCTFGLYSEHADISAIPIVHKLSHLPITSDPSHGTGRAIR